jgi:hypothetical protein
MSDLNESIEALEAFSAQIIEAETDVKAEDSDDSGEGGKLSFEFDSAEEAAKMAEKIGCTGSHKGGEYWIPCSTEEAFQAILDADKEKALVDDDVEVKEVDRDDADNTRSMIEGIIQLANSEEDAAEAAAAQMEFDDQEEAVLASEILACSGLHEGKDGKFMPCSTHEALVEAVSKFEPPVAPDPEETNPEKAEDEDEVEVKSEEGAEIVEAEDVEVKSDEEIEAADLETAEFVEEKTADDLLEMMDADEDSSEDSETSVKSEDLLEMMEPEAVSVEEEVSGAAAIEALAVKSAGEGAELVNSGYSPTDDTYVIDVKTADGIIREYFYSGSGEEKGYLVVEAAAEHEDFISEEKAAELALEYKAGSIVSIEPGLILGNDAFVVEIDEVDGKSYDVFVSLKGDILGHDEYEMVTQAVHSEEDLAEIKALEAELEIKRMYGRGKREELAESGEAMADGSFPIVDEADLKNAIQAHGRAKDIEAAKKHIVKRAKALGLEALVPTEWGMAPKGEDEEEKALDSAEDLEEKSVAVEDEIEVGDNEPQTIESETEVAEEEASDDQDELEVEVAKNETETISDDALLAEFADLLNEI